MLPVHSQETITSAHYNSLMHAQTLVVASSGNPTASTSIVHPMPTSTLTLTLPLKSCSGEPQWERPDDFIPIVRENLYATTPEQEFIKSVLSPKRSKVSLKAHRSLV